MVFNNQAFSLSYGKIKKLIFLAIYNFLGS